MNLNFSEYRAIVEFSPNMIWRCGTDAKCNYFNKTWLKFTGKKISDEIGDGWAESVHPDDLDFCIKTFLESFNVRKRFEMHYRLKRYDGQWRWINDRGVPFFDENGVFIGYIGSCIDVTEKIEGQKLIEMALNDKLTGLYNRNYIELSLEYEFNKAEQEKTDLIIIMMDVDKFKFVNDQYGHGVGDKVLNQVAQKISDSIRKTDIAGRFGGDEFITILPNTKMDEAEKIAQRILSSVLQIKIDNYLTGISLSIGIVKKGSENNVNIVIEKADKAMYHAKQDGGNKYYLYTEE